MTTSERFLADVSALANTAGGDIVFGITDAQQTDEEVLRPVCDRFWNAFGYERSMSFNAAGNYVGERY